MKLVFVILIIGSIICTNAFAQKKALVEPRLYEKPIIKEIKNEEFAEVIAIFDSITEFSSDEFFIKVLRVCNGPSDTTLEYCNCSHNIYISTGTYDLGSEYKLFKIGPFFFARFIGWNTDKLNPILTIEHNFNGKKKRTSISIEQNKVQIN